VVAALGLLVAVHAVLALLPEKDATWWMVALAFVPARLSGLAQQLPGGTTAIATSFLTHMLVHGDVTHLALNGAWLLAFGGAIAKRAGGLRFAVLSVLCGLGGAVVFLALNVGLLAPMVGASGAISGLMGAVFRFLFNAEGSSGLWRLRHAPGSIPLMPLGAALANRRVLTAIAVWLGVNLLALIGFGTVGSSGGIAWEAHMGGFLAGFLLYGWFDRGGGSSEGWPAEEQGER
jgi:membrane associated rhomboid family serine protease